MMADMELENNDPHEIHPYSFIVNLLSPSDCTSGHCGFCKNHSRYNFIFIALLMKMSAVLNRTVLL